MIVDFGSDCIANPQFFNPTLKDVHRRPGDQEVVVQLSVSISLATEDQETRRFVFTCLFLAS
ncbi:MAG: hypothetical protein DMF91_17655 [Acidobacteria bacterium]|nr:MAG: hypothetical protein DMF91_17655 [Acidobacteriota bacterium]